MISHLWWPNTRQGYLETPKIESTLLELLLAFDFELMNWGKVFGYLRANKYKTDGWKKYKLDHGTYIRC